MKHHKTRAATGLIPLLLCGLTATAPSAAFAQAKSGVAKATPGVAEACSAQLSCRVGRSLIYDYSSVFVGEADVQTIQENGFASAQISGNAQVALTTVASTENLCTYEVALTEVSVAEVVRGEVVESPRDEDLAALVGDSYYFTQSADGQIVDVMIGREDLPEAATFKRGVINALNVTLRGDDRYEVMETDISGTHRAVYTATSDRYSTTLSRDLTKSGDPLLKADIAAFDFESQQTSSVAIDHNSCIISQVNIDEEVIIDQPGPGDPAVSGQFHHETVKVRATANMQLIQTGFASSTAAPTKADLADLVRLSVDANIEVSPGLVNSGQKIGEVLELLRQDPTNLELAREISRAVRNDAQGLRILGRYIADVRPTGQLAHTLGSLLISLGSPEAQGYLVDSLLVTHQDDENLERLIGLSTLVDEPTAGLVKAVSSFANNTHTSSGAAATLALGAYAHKLRSSQPKVTASIVENLSSNLSLAGYDESILYLRALGNAGAESSLDQLTPYLTSQDRLTRLSAVVAMRKIESSKVEDLLLEQLFDEESESVQQAIQRVITERADKGLSEQSDLAKAVIIDWAWSRTYGGNFLSATVSASALVEDEPYLVNLQAAASVDGPLGFSADLLDVQLLTEEASAQDRRFRFFIMLGGNEIANIDETETCSVDGENTLWDESINLVNLSTPPIPIIGPLTLSFDLDLGVELSINFFRDGDWCSANSNLQMGLTPGVGISADGYATLSLLLVRGGVGIAGNLVSLELPIYADADLLFQDAPQVCFKIDVVLKGADMQLYAWGQYNTIFGGWRPNPRPRWTLWQFTLIEESWTILEECAANPDLNCLPDVLWWNGTTIDAWYDGANCFVASPPAGSTPFISNNAYYIAQETSCPAGMPWDGTGCLEANIYLEPGIGVYLNPSSSELRLTFYKFGFAEFIPPCPSGWTTVQSAPDFRICSTQPAPGYSANDYFITSVNSYLYKLYLDGSASCAAGNPDSTGCFLGNAPGGTDAFVWSGNFYYSEP